MRTLKYLALMCVCSGACSVAQDTIDGKASGISSLAPAAAQVAELEFSKPTTVQDLDSGSMIAGRFDCSGDGSVYTLIDGYALSAETAPGGKLALMAIRPDGSITNFSWRSVHGFINISLPISIFVGNDLVYVLVNGAKRSAAQGYMSNYPLILAFDNQGTLVDTVVLDQNLRPLVLGVFPSGNILLVSEDRLNHRMALNLVGRDGTPIRELQLGDHDFVVRAARMSPSAHGTTNYSPLLLLSMSKFFPSGDNLLLVPLETAGLPILELDEHGVLQSVVPRLPDNMVLESFLSSNAADFKLRLASLVETDKETLDARGKVLGVATRPSERIGEFSRDDGSLLREIDIGGPGVQPACENKGTFRFLTSNNQRSLQVVTARVR
jgi:hypothetical protein